MSTTAKRMKKLTIAASFLLGAFIWLQMGTVGLAVTQGTVTGSSVKVRQDAGTSASVLASVKKGDVVDVIEAVTASDGTTWYRMYINADTIGYIRSDFVQLSGSVTTATVTETPTTTTPTTTETPSGFTTQVTAMQSQSGTVINDQVRVRKEASTSTDIVTTVSKGTVITLTGTATGADNKQWYQVSFISNGAEVVGFIRSDFITIGAAVTTETPDTGSDTTAAGTGETGTDGTDTGTDGTQTDTDTEGTDSPTPGSTDDYEAVYTTDENGEYVWYLYDRVEGVRYKIASLLKLETEANEDLEGQSSTILKFKIAVIVLIFIIVAMIIGVTVYIFRTRDNDYDDDDDVRRPVRRPVTHQVGPGQGARPQSTRPAGTRPQGAPGSRPQSPQGQGNRPAGQAVRPGAAQGQAVRPAGARPQGTPGSRPQSPQGQGNRPAGQGVRPGTAQGQTVRPAGTRPQGAPGSRPQSPQAQESRPAAPEGRPVAPQNADQQAPYGESKKPSWKAKNFLDDNDEFEFDFLDFEEDEK